MFQVIEQAQKNQNNPQDLFKQITKNYSQEQKERIFNQAKQFGVSEEDINKLR